jgi:hypothetical protein
MSFDSNYSRIGAKAGKVKKDVPWNEERQKADL